VYDIGQSGQNELRSATETAVLVQEFFAPRPQLEADEMANRVSRLILTTQIDATITQQVDPTDYASLLLCDADHSSMGMRFGTYLDDALKLFVEANADVTDHDKRVQKLLEFLRFNIVLLGDRTFFTEEARKLFGKQRTENARTLNKFVNDQSLELVLKAIKV
jgi:predicted metal-dependent HD superfamily phosphohydrolase